MKKLIFLFIVSVSIIVSSCDKGGCSDGEKNQDETAIDCGGECAPCETCSDGIKNQDEIEVDCGGSTCTPCETCSDGIKNQDEEEIDCGGSSCNVCPSCSDGVKNGSETDVDCGGDCVECGKQTFNVPCSINSSSISMSIGGGSNFYQAFNMNIIGTTAVLLEGFNSDSSMQVEIYFPEKPVLNKIYKMVNGSTTNNSMLSDNVKISIVTGTPTNSTVYKYYGKVGSVAYVHATATGLKVEWCFTDFNSTDAGASETISMSGNFEKTY